MIDKSKDAPATEYTFRSDRASLTWPDRIPPLPCAIVLPAALYELAREEGLDLGPRPGDPVH